MEKRSADTEESAAPKRARIFDEVYGANASAELELRLESLPGDRNGMLKAPDVQELLLWCLSEAVPAPRWFALKNRPLLGRVVLVLAEGLGTDVAPLASLLPLRAPFKAPGDRRSFVNALPMLLTCSGVVQKKNKKAKKREAARVAASGTWSVAELMLTQEQLREHAYPLAGEPIRSAAHRSIPQSEFVDSMSVLSALPEESASDAPHLLAVDCEMCRTSVGLELARVSVVDAEGRPLLDELVKPPRAVLDYNTQWSGITAATLEHVTTSLDQARARLLGLMRRSTVLVGHSLENDLLALRLCHQSVIDTAILFPPGRGGAGAKCSLRTLAQRFLGVAIQQGAHDSTEDAATTMRLVQHKLSQPRLSKEDLAHPALFDVLMQASPPCHSTVVARPEVLPRAHASSASLIGCLTDEAAVAAALRQVQKEAQSAHTNRFVVLHLSDLARAQADTVRLLESGEGSGGADECSAARGATLSRIEQVWQGVPKDTLVALLSLHGPPMELRRALLQRKRAEGEQATKLADEAVESAATEARNGVLLLGIKR